MIPAPLLEFDDATVCVGQKIVLDSISFRIECGEHVVILGPNGSGKSTLIKTITREHYPMASDGRSPVRILGQDTWNVFELRAMLGIVSPNLQHMFDRGISGREVTLSGFFSSVGVPPHQHVTEKMERRAEEIIDFLEIPHLSEKRMTEMSTGEARKVLIARALVHKPKALILDEPVNGLDPRAARRFGNTLRKIAKSGKSVIMVTHHLPDIIPEITRVIMIKDGRIFLDGAKGDVLTRKNLSDLFDMQVEVDERNGFFYLWA